MSDGISRMKYKKQGEVINRHSQEIVKHFMSFYSPMFGHCTLCCIFHFLLLRLLLVCFSRSSFLFFITLSAVSFTISFSLFWLSSPISLSITCSVSLLFMILICFPLFPYTSFSSHPRSFPFFIFNLLKYFPYSTHVSSLKVYSYSSSHLLRLLHIPSNICVLHSSHPSYIRYIFSTYSTSSSSSLFRVLHYLTIMLLFDYLSKFRTKF